MKLYNTLSRKIEEFEPLNPPKVGLYTCGPTVYDYEHIGHGRKYVNDDILTRTLSYFNYEVNHVQNVTDVGHLVSDADEGEDKLEKGAKKHNKSVYEVVDFFTKHFYRSMDMLNIKRPNIIAKATEHILAQIKLVSQLVDKNYAYDTPEAVYFNVTKFKNYGALDPQQMDEKKTAVREEVQTGDHKKNPADFALWFKRVGRFKDHIMHWDSPWGDGFPGWHIECSAMSMQYLGPTLDIHTGGVDHIAVHHPNEIAQSEGATGREFVKYWVHHEMLLVNGKKMSKSLDNVYKIEDIIEKGFEPLDLRYLYLTAHYRKQQNFTWEALKSVRTTRIRLGKLVSQWDDPRENGIEELETKFSLAICNDLNMPEALAVLWETVNSDYPTGAKHASVLKMDKVLGLQLDKVSDGRLKLKNLPDKIQKLVQKRQEYRKQKEWKQADILRGEINEHGYEVEDMGASSAVYAKDRSVNK
ncbi:cysteine--tRNA ligase [Candidatus Roizmanbacteria bacterium CG22_combo_CG10-13_8_21_14_all_38_20]|uniref:Cysteine--tRNA ligase n=1 Tax=Candidatus Roizmanbacteria bacterium CG22_combo_CG10-13_8_21_14_all_38_20 TaxID=1974862 RepID=A0A2H0BW36_9BACT|nr:cysteine--tRNA ligase [Candidatus Microgenomates bacterium]PIP61814.1 MAG: cysteine--tRNA ligase [Candidatus Roizmanbacteria bacterium CG22_combo_CG10-13_8_21_14_all_38_20]PJC31659.1 MAG: cysteine--tRNA ligase [Candidatus Roizmanbacteria bacterium CG_4_9_14_0_2_um_filter_38_17]